MSPVTRNALVIPSGYTSQEVASFIAQLDDLLARQHDQTRKLTPADLEWQPAPGMNTIGMLMAHQAVVEVAWTGLGIEDLQRDQVRFKEILGIGNKDDGMPLPEDGAPSAPPWPPHTPHGAWHRSFVALRFGPSSLPPAYWVVVAQLLRSDSDCADWRIHLHFVSCSRTYPAARRRLAVASEVDRGAGSRRFFEVRRKSTAADRRRPDRPAAGHQLL